jgi:hypothetical protein
MLSILSLLEAEAVVITEAVVVVLEDIAHLFQGSLLVVVLRLSLWQAFLLALILLWLGLVVRVALFLMALETTEQTVVILRLARLPLLVGVEAVLVVAQFLPVMVLLVALVAGLVLIIPQE